MKIKQTIITLAFMIGIGGIFGGDVALATTTKCAGHDTAIISCSNTVGKTIETTGVWSIVIIAIDILTAGVGVLAVAGIVYGSILYTSAGDSSEKVTKARAVIRNVVIGIIAYASMYALLNFLIPGGLFA